MIGAGAGAGEKKVPGVGAGQKGTGSATLMRIRIRNTTFNDRTFNASVQSLVFAVASQVFVVEQF